MKELDSAVLERKVPEHGLEPGDIGTVVFCYDAEDAYEVEFMTGSGRTVAVLTLEHGEIRPISPDEIYHARKVQP